MAFIVVVIILGIWFTMLLPKATGIPASKTLFLVAGCILGCIAMVGLLAIFSIYG